MISGNKKNNVSRLRYTHLLRIRTVIKWCIKRGLTRNNPFDQYQIAQPMYGDPFYLTLEERDKMCIRDSIKDGFLEYMPQKTKKCQAKTIRVPLHEKAVRILERYSGNTGKLLPEMPLPPERWKAEVLMP